MMSSSPQAWSSGSPPCLVLRVVRVHAAPGYSRTSAPCSRMLAIGLARWFRVGLAPCSMTSDAGCTAILAILTCRSPNRYGRALEGGPYIQGQPASCGVDGHLIASTAAPPRRPHTPCGTTASPPARPAPFSSGRRGFLSACKGHVMHVPPITINHSALRSQAFHCRVDLHFGAACPIDFFNQLWSLHCVL
jgi:hypothetical protein